MTDDETDPNGETTGDPNGETTGDPNGETTGDPNRETTSGQTEIDPGTVRRQTPGEGRTPTAEAIEPSAPAEFGLVQVWWGSGKGKTTAAMGMGFRAAGHGYRVHMLQFMKGGADSVEAVRGEYNAIDAFPGFSYENTGHYGWHDLPDGSEDERHERNAQAGFERAQELIEAAHDAEGPLPLDSPADDGCHMLILDEILYAVSRDLVDGDDLRSLVESRPDDLELVLTGSHDEPTAVLEMADLVSHVHKEKHPIDEGQRARKGTEY